MGVSIQVTKLAMESEHVLPKRTSPFEYSRSVTERVQASAWEYVGPSTKSSHVHSLPIMIIAAHTSSYPTPSKFSLFDPECMYIHNSPVAMCSYDYTHPGQIWA
jgi:hypothetical protein